VVVNSSLWAIPLFTKVFSFLQRHAEGRYSGGYRAMNITKHNLPETTKAEKIRILLADDDDMFRDAFMRLMEHHGYDCLGAADAATAERMLEGNETDALIADIHMPGNSRLELVEKVAQILPGLPVILLTGGAEVETAARSVGLGVTAYLVKPVDTVELLAIVERAVSVYRQLRRVRASLGLLRNWAGELAVIEESLSHRSPASANGAMQDYLRVTLRNLTRQIVELDYSVGVSDKFGSKDMDLGKLDLIAALRQTIEVLEKSRQSFHSKDLGALRKQLQNLLSTAETPGGNSPV
jgi:DNA-binding response OmpR family regulator